MKVYALLVEDSDYETIKTRLLSVFKTRTLAENRVEDIIKKAKRRDWPLDYGLCRTVQWSSYDFDIKEVELEIEKTELE